MLRKDRFRVLLAISLLTALALIGCQTQPPTPTATPIPSRTPTPTATDTPTVTPTPTPSQAVVVPGRDLLVVAGPGMDYAIVGTIPAGTPIPIYAISPDGGWAMISPLGQDGAWIGLSPFVALHGDLDNVGLWGATPRPSVTPTPPFPSSTPIPSDTPAPTLDMGALVATVEAAVVATLNAQAQATFDMQATDQTRFVATATALVEQPVDVSADDDPATGPQDAPVLIIEFADFTCPYCARFAQETAPQLLEMYAGQVRFVFRDAPILSTMSSQAAMASECADDQGRYWEYHDLLFANQRSLSRDLFLSLAAQLELDVDTFTTCLDEETHLAEVEADLQDAIDTGLTGVPTLFINGRRVIGAQPLNVFRQVIDAQLEAR